MNDCGPEQADDIMNPSQDREKVHKGRKEQEHGYDEEQYH